MRRIYSVEIKYKGKWKKIEFHKCNRMELDKLKRYIINKIIKDTSPTNQFRITRELNGVVNRY